MNTFVGKSFTEIDEFEIILTKIMDFLILLLTKFLYSY